MENLHIFFLVSVVNMSRSNTIKSDFLSWDDLNLQELFEGEYTDNYLDESDSDFESEKSESEQKMYLL